MTNDLARRISEHREGIGAGFPTAFHCKKILYHEHYRNVHDAIAREKQLKNWARSKKVDLIRRLNPNWNDLAADILQEPSQRQMESPASPTLLAALRPRLRSE